MLSPVLSARKRSQCLTKIRMSGSPHSPKFPTVALQRSKSSASVRSGVRIETSGSCTLNILSLSLLRLSCSKLCLNYLTIVTKPICINIGLVYGLNFYISSDRYSRMKV